MEKFIYNKIGILFGLLIAGLLFTTSCKKLIEIPKNPPNELPQQEVFTDSAGTMSAIAGIYAYYYNEFGFQDGSLSRLTGLSSDEFNTSLTFDANTSQFYSNTLLTNNSYVQTFWSTIYAALYKVNVCITGVQQSNGLSAPLKQQLLGELKTVRALYYFNLVNLFGGVPLVTSTDYNVNAVLPRSSADQIYTQIFTDLADAQKALKPDYPSEGRARPNLYTAEALLAKVNLYKGQWQAAYNMADDVIRSGLYQLEPNLNNVFLDGSVEAIWQLPATGSYTQTNEAVDYIPYASTIIPNYFFSDSLVKAFEVNDQRLVNWAGVNTVPGDGTTPDRSYYYPYKYKNLYAPYATTEDFMVFRLSEQLLIRAEAGAHINNLSGALDDLNQVRQRAGLGKSTATSQDDILSAIIRERRVELFSEWGDRWYDLKRLPGIKKPGISLADEVLGSEKAGWKSTDVLYPIPYLEISKNTKLTQNPGYN